MLTLVPIGNQPAPVFENRSQNRTRNKIMMLDQTPKLRLWLHLVLRRLQQPATALIILRVSWQ